MKKKKEKSNNSPYKYKFEEYGPVYIQRDETEIMCEPTGVAFYTLSDFGISEEPSVAYFESVDISDFNATDDNGDTIELSDEEKDEVCSIMIDELFENQQNLKLKK